MRGVRILLGVILAIGGLTAGTSTASAADAPEGEGPAAGKESCWIAGVGNGIPPGNDSVERCHDIFSELSTTGIDGGITVSWTLTPSAVRWFCGPSGALTDCPVNEVRVETINWNPLIGRDDKRCSAGPSEGTCTLTGLRNGQVQQVTVSSYLANGNFFRVYLVETPCCDPPGAPTGVQAAVSGTSLDATWQAPANWGGSTTLEFDVTTIPAQASCTTDALACRLDGLTPGQTYEVQVTARNRSGSSGPAVSPAYQIPVTVPDAPQVQSVKYRPVAKATVAWTVPADGGTPITGYTVSASPGGRTCTAKASQTSCTVTGLTGGKQYSFTVRAKNSVGASEASSPAVAGVLAAPSSRPQGVSVDVSGSQAVVTWRKPRKTGGGRLIRYVVQAGPGGPTCTTRARTCRLTGLALGRTYDVAVSAVNTGGASRPTVVSATVPAPRPEPPAAPKPEQELS